MGDLRRWGGGQRTRRWWVLACSGGWMLACIIGIYAIVRFRQLLHHIRKLSRQLLSTPGQSIPEAPQAEPVAWTLAWRVASKTIDHWTAAKLAQFNSMHLGEGDWQLHSRESLLTSAKIVISAYNDGMGQRDNDVTSILPSSPSPLLTPVRTPTRRTQMSPLAAAAGVGDQPRVVLSYQTKDVQFMLKLRERLNDEGISTVDGLQVPPGSDWRHFYFAHLRKADILLPLLSQTFMFSRACESELTYAEDKGKEIIPITCQSSYKRVLAKPEEFTEKDPDIETRMAKFEAILNTSNSFPAQGQFGDDFESNLNKLLQRINTVLANSRQLNRIGSGHAALELEVLDDHDSRVDKVLEFELMQCVAVIKSHGKGDDAEGWNDALATGDMRLFDIDSKPPHQRKRRNAVPHVVMPRAAVAPVTAALDPIAAGGERLIEVVLKQLAHLLWDDEANRPDEHKCVEVIQALPIQCLVALLNTKRPGLLINAVVCLRMLVQHDGRRQAGSGLEGVRSAAVQCGVVPLLLREFGKALREHRVDTTVDQRKELEHVTTLCIRFLSRDKSSVHAIAQEGGIEKMLNVLHHGENHTLGSKNAALSVLWCLVYEDSNKQVMIDHHAVPLVSAHCMLLASDLSVATSNPLRCCLFVLSHLLTKHPQRVNECAPDLCNALCSIVQHSDQFEIIEGACKLIAPFATSASMRVRLIDAGTVGTLLTLLQRQQPIDARSKKNIEGYKLRGSEALATLVSVSEDAAASARLWLDQHKPDVSVLFWVLTNDSLRRLFWTCASANDSFVYLQKQLAAQPTFDLLAVVIPSCASATELSELLQSNSSVLKQTLSNRRHVPRWAVWAQSMTHMVQHAGRIEQPLFVKALAEMEVIEHAVNWIKAGLPFKSFAGALLEQVVIGANVLVKESIQHLVEADSSDTQSLNAKIEELCCSY